MVHARNNGNHGCNGQDQEDQPASSCHQPLILNCAVNVAMKSNCYLCGGINVVLTKGIMAVMGRGITSAIQ